MAIQPQVTAGGSRQRVLVLALAGVLLVVLAGVVARPLLLGGTAAAPPAAAPAPTTAAAPTTVTQLIGPSTSIAGPTAGTAKDPFRPVVGAGSGGTAGTTATTVGVTTTVTTVAPAAAGTGASASGTARRTVVLERVDAGPGPRRVRVSVDGTSHTAAEGGRFAGRYRVLDIGATCATFATGAALFTLCEGESVLK